MKRVVPKAAGVRALLGFVGLAAACSLWWLVGEWYGQREGVRFWGIALLGMSVVFTFRERIPVSLGSIELEPLAGWRKAFVLVPSYAIGLVVSLAPHQVACAVNWKGYVCGSG